MNLVSNATIYSQFEFIQMRNEINDSFNSNDPRFTVETQGFSTSFNSLKKERSVHLYYFLFIEFIISI